MKLYFERIFYYWRQSMYGHVHALSALFLKENGVDPLFFIWDALASGAEGKTNAGLNALEKITNRVAMGLPISVAQLCVHKMAKIPDFASIGRIESEIENLQKSASAAAVVQAAQIFWLSGNISQALSLVHPLTTQAPANKAAAALVGWIKLTVADRNSGRWFDMASAETTMTQKSADPFVIYGKALYFANISRWQDGLQLLVQLSNISEFPEIAYERARIYIAMSNWDLALDAAAEATSKSVSDCDLHLFRVIHALSQTGDLEAARPAVESLCDSIDNFENENATFVVPVMKALMGLSWKDKDIISRCLKTFISVMKANREDGNVCVV
jgi:tetratricopeptide repeat protein 21B